MIHRLAKMYSVPPSHYLMGSRAILTMDYAVYLIGIQMDNMLEEKAHKDAERRVQNAQNAHLKPHMQ